MEFLEISPFTAKMIRIANGRPHPTNLPMKQALLLSLCLIPFIAPLTSCERKGPAETTGEKIDNAAEEIKDAVEPKGPVEKAGEKVDDALNH